jgi:ribosome-binding factor A
MLRVNQVVRQVLGDAIERLRDADDRLGMVTITDVEVAGDLSIATVFCSSLSAEQAAALEERRAQLQGAVAREVTLKRTPKLQFVVDPSIESGARIEALLAKLRDERDEG